MSKQKQQQQQELLTHAALLSETHQKLRYSLFFQIIFTCLSTVLAVTANYRCN